MKRLKKTAALLLVSCVILLSLFLPRLVFDFQQETLYNQVKTCPAESVQLTPAPDLLDRLQLLNGSYTMTELSTGDKRSAEQAQEAAQTALDTVLAPVFSQLDADSFAPLSVTPYLLLSKDHASSAVIWECMLIDQTSGSFVVFQLDDSTGLMLSFQLAGPPVTSSDVSDTLGNLLADYYELTLDDISVKDYYDLADQSSCIITLKNDSGESVDCPLLLLGDVVQFNYEMGGSSSISVMEA